MPTYTTIPNTQIEPEAPVTSELMTLLRDNPLAIQEGDDTAPRVLSPALGLTYKTGSATRNSDGTSTVVTLDTTDLSNLADMTLALVTGAISVTSTDGITTVEVNCNRATPTFMQRATSTGGTQYATFSRLVTLSSATSISVSFDFDETIAGSATVYAEILILGR